MSKLGPDLLYLSSLYVFVHLQTIDTNDKLIQSILVNEFH